MRDQLNTTWRANLLGNTSVPLLVLIVCVLSFGLLIPFLGFYWDDWLVIFHAQTGRTADLISVHSFDRPLSFWTALISTSLLGLSPINWHIFALFVRILAVLAMWWALRAIWPRHSKQLGWAALFFAVYPAYFLQSISVSFSQHWIAYGLFFVSLGSMGWALRRPERFRAFSLLAFLTAALHMATLEYFAGLELIRPLYLYILMSQEKDDWRQSIREVVRVWWPYLLLWLLWAVWRLFLLELPYEPHAPQLLLEFRDNPIATSFSFVELVLQSYVHLLWSVWQRLLSPELFDLRNRFQLFAWIVGLITSVILFYAGGRLLASNQGAQGRQQIAKWCIALGLTAIFVGLMPAWVIGKTPIQVGYGERFALPALFGAALFWTGTIWLFVENSQRRRLIFALLLGLAVSAHLRAGNSFRLEWQQQQNYYEQLSWRAPALEPGTAIISFNPLSEVMPVELTSLAINTLYPQSMSQSQVDYWAFELDRTLNVRAIQDGEIFKSNYRGILFEADNAESLLFTYQPEGGCLWMLTPLDAQNDYLPFEHRALVSSSNLNRIQAEEQSAGGPEQKIFGAQKPEGWCYFYQRAELARQLGHWQEVVALMKEAEEKGVSANYGVERLALVEAHIRLGNWAEAEQLSEEIYAKHVRNSSMLCALWEQFSNEGLLGEPGLMVLEDVVEFAHCEAG